MRKQPKKYVNVLTGARISEEAYNKLSKSDALEYDKISSLRKAKATVTLDSDAVSDEEE